MVCAIASLNIELTSFVFLHLPVQLSFLSFSFFCDTKKAEYGNQWVQAAGEDLGREINGN